MESQYSFKNLELWKAAQAVAVDLCRLADSLPSKRSADVVARQLIRSATSVAANIAEGHGRFSYAAYLHHLSVAKGSATESQGWIDMLVRLGHLTEADGAALDRRCSGLIAAITRRIGALEQQQKVRQIREDGPIYTVDEPEVPRFPGSQIPYAGDEVQL